MRATDPFDVRPFPASSRSRRTRRCLPWSLLLFVSVLGACTDRAEPPERAPDVVFRTLAGESLTLAEAAGPTLVNFWSTSCTVCLREMPGLAVLRDDYAPRGFELVAVAMPHDRPDIVLELAEARGWTFPVALDIDGAVLAAFEPVPGTPTSFLIGADGRIVERHVGPIDPGALRRVLDRLLDDAEPRAASAARSTPPPRA